MLIGQTGPASVQYEFRMEHSVPMFTSTFCTFTENMMISK